MQAGLPPDRIELGRGALRELELVSEDQTLHYPPALRPQMKPDFMHRRLVRKAKGNRLQGQSAAGAETPERCPAGVGLLGDGVSEAGKEGGQVLVRVQIRGNGCHSRQRRLVRPLNLLGGALWARDAVGAERYLARHRQLSCFHSSPWARFSDLHQIELGVGSSPYK